MPSTKCFALFRTVLRTVLIRRYFAKKNLNSERDFLKTALWTKTIISSDYTYRLEFTK